MYTTAARPIPMVLVIPKGISKRAKQLGLSLDDFATFHRVAEHFTDEDLLELLVLNDTLRLGNQTPDTLKDQWYLNLANARHGNGRLDFGNAVDPSRPDLQNRLRQLYRQLEDSKTHTDVLNRYFDRTRETQSQDVSVERVSELVIVIEIEPYLFNLQTLSGLMAGSVDHLEDGTAEWRLIQEVVRLLYVYHTADHVAKTDWYRLYLRGL